MRWCHDGGGRANWRGRSGRAAQVLTSNQKAASTTGNVRPSHVALKLRLDLESVLVGERQPTPQEAAIISLFHAARRTRKVLGNPEWATAN